MLAVSWSSDFGGFGGTSIYPEWNVYYGLGSDNNLGIGLQLFGITHLSYSKYFDIDGTSNWHVYGNLNQLVSSIYTNQYMEIGVGTTDISYNRFSTFQIGLTYGHAMKYGMFQYMPHHTNNQHVMQKFTHIKRILPFARYLISDETAGGSFDYYWGRSDLIYDNIMHAITAENDTIMHVPFADSLYRDTLNDIVSYDSYIIYCGEKPLSCGTAEAYLMMAAWPYYLIPDLSETWSPIVRNFNAYVQLDEYKGEEFLTNESVFVPFCQGQDDLTILRFPKSLRETLQKPTKIWRDVSIGIAAIRYYE